MNIKFSILWFDDNEAYFDSLDIAHLEEEIQGWGFLPNIVNVMNPEDFTNAYKSGNYDLIVVDRNLEGYPDGKDFISNIRANAIYTEVIFYTASNVRELWDEIREKELEGVFVSSRNDIESKIIRIGRQSIRKILDLENMRGIVMAEVGELDLLIADLLSIGMLGISDEHRYSMFQKSHESASQQLQSSVKEWDSILENMDIVHLLNLCDSSKRWQNFNRLQKHHIVFKGRQRMGNYEEEVLKPRNFLAHGIPRRLPEGGVLFSYRGKDYLFNDETSVQLRKSILRYKSELLTLIKLLKQEAK